MNRRLQTFLSSLVVAAGLGVFPLFAPSPAAAGETDGLSLDRCSPVVGTLLAGRWYMDARPEEGKTKGLNLEGKVHLSFGLTCPLYAWKHFSLIGSGFAGTVVDTTTVMRDEYEQPDSVKTDSPQVAGLAVGVDYESKGQLSLGGAWETAKSFQRQESYLVVLMYSTTFENIGILLGKIAGESDE